MNFKKIILGLILALPVLSFAQDPIRDQIKEKLPPTRKLEIQMYDEYYYQDWICYARIQVVDMAPPAPLVYAGDKVLLKVCDNIVSEEDGIQVKWTVKRITLSGVITRIHYTTSQDIVLVPNVQTGVVEVTVEPVNPLLDSYVGGDLLITVGDATRIVDEKEPTARMSQNATSGHSINNVFPNPSVGNFSVSVISDSEEMVTYKITSIDGSIIKTEQVTLIDGINQIDVNIPNTSKGMYFIHLIGKEGKIMDYQTIVLQ